MVRLPQFARRTKPATAPAGPPGRTPADDGATDDPARQREHARRAAEHATAGRAASERAADQTEAERMTATPAAPPPAPTGPRPRTSALTTLGLVTGVAGTLLVLSGALAPYGIALGVLALAFAIGGISATSRRHIAGRGEAVLGLLLALCAIVVGGLALTGALAWLTTETDTVNRLREWLDARFADR